MLGEPDDSGKYGHFSGDQAWNQAAQEAGWVRVKPMPNPTDKPVIFAESARELTAFQEDVLHRAEERGLEVRRLGGGALANRAAFSEYRMGKNHPDGV